MGVDAILEFFVTALGGVAFGFGMQDFHDQLKKKVTT
jgi:hypothetical protein